MLSNTYSSSWLWVNDNVKKKLGTIRDRNIKARVLMWLVRCLSVGSFSSVTSAPAVYGIGYEPEECMVEKKTCQVTANIFSRIHSCFRCQIVVFNEGDTLGDIVRISLVYPAFLFEMI